MSDEQEPAQANAPEPKEPEVKYVLSGQPTGWWAAAKDVREFDVEKVTSCKEDIDTLLVFAGLFSAVLSAFLVAVYPNLQQQPSDRIVYAIERVATQTAGYRVNLTDGTLIAANIPPPSPPSFQVSDEDIRVNVLWFASLIISLVTASFGMLVKQWLREFLASEDPSALHRLRLRHFREPQMRAWMVYEIAGLLPILLHLSLGLFFVGLCYFTASVHSSIGYTTVPLVVGWALCFFAATALPIFFPRCPYKVAFLKVLIVRVHRLVRGSAKWLYSRIDERNHEDNSRRNEDRDAGQFFAAAVRRATAVWAKCRNYMTSRFRAVVTATQDMKSLFTAAVKAVRDISDESILVESPKYDLDILSSVDAIQGNDEMLATIIPEALFYTRPDPADVVQLVIELLEHRVPTLEPSRRIVEYWPFEDMNPWYYLRPQARDYILAILFGHIKDLDVRGGCYPGCFGAVSQSPGQLCRDHIAVFRALFLVASAPRESLPPSAVKFLEECFEVACNRRGFWRWLCYDPATTDHDASQKLMRVLVVINLINDLTITGQLQLSLEHRVEFSTQIPHPYFPNLVDEHIDTTTYPWDTWRLDVRGDAKLKFSCIVFWLHAALEGLNSLQSETSADLPPLLTSVVKFSLRLFYKWVTGYWYRGTTDTDYQPAYNSFWKIVHIAVKRESTALAFMTMLIDEFQATPDEIHRDGWPLVTALFELQEYNCDQSPRRDPTVIYAILQLGMSNITTYQEREPGINSHLRLCYVLEFFLITIYVPPDLREECRRIFASLATSLPAIPDLQDLPWVIFKLSLESLAQSCLAITGFEDCVFSKSDSPPGSEEESIFPDILLNTLLTLSGEEGRGFLPRTPKTQPAIEPGSSSAAVTELASTSNQGIDTSNLVPSMSEGESEPAFTTQDAAQNQAEIAEEEDVRSSDGTEH